MSKVKKALGKGLALATLVTAAVALAHAMKKNKKAKMLKSAAEDAKDNVVAHAKRLGGVSKKSYAKVVDAVMAEYGTMKTLTKKEMTALSEDLKGGWVEAKKTLKTKKADAKKKR